MSHLGSQNQLREPRHNAKIEAERAKPSSEDLQDSTVAWQTSSETDDETVHLQVHAGQYLKGGVDEAHELLQRAVQWRAGHPCSPQQLYCLGPRLTKVHHLASAQHEGTCEEATHVRCGLLY